MIELLYITLIIFGGFLPFFFFFFKFKYMKIFILSILILISIVIWGANPAKFDFNSNYLYEKQKLDNFQKLEDYPIDKLKGIYENGTFKYIVSEEMSDKKFSLIKTKDYSTQCLENYYIKEGLSCPITDIKIENKNTSEYKNFIKINDNEYLFYTKENKLGKLYKSKSFNYNDFKKNKVDILSIDKIIRREFHKLSNPFHTFKKFTFFFDSFNLSLSFISLFFTMFFEDSEDLKCNIMKIINTFIFQLILTILAFIRFILFIECKNFLFANKDIYYYEFDFPNEIFNLDIFPLGICINIFLYNILNIVLPKIIFFCKNRKSLENNNDNNNFENKRNIEMDLLLISIMAFLFPNFNFLFISNEIEINLKNNYDYIINNWKMNPISSIKLKDNIDGNLKINFEDYFEIERVKDYNYINIFPINRGKICGKDNNGNYLFFPEGKDCPINRLFFSNTTQDLPNYKNITFNNNSYLYYTNQFTEGKILIDLWDEYSSNEWSDANNAFSIPFKQFINSPYFNGLYSIYYIGINISSIKENYNDKIENFERNIEIYKSLPFVIFIIFCIELFLSLLPSIIMICIKLKVIYFILFILVNLSFISLLIIYLNIDIKYIINFLDKINSDFEFFKSEIRIDIIILIIASFISLIIFIIFIKFISSSKNEDSENDEYKENLINDLDKYSITPKGNQISEINENKDNNDINLIKEEEGDYKNKDEIIKINEEKKDGIKIIKDNEIKNLNNEEINKIKEIDSNSDGIENLIIEDNKTSENLLIELDDSNKNSFHILHDKKENDVLKNDLPFELKENEKLMCVIIQCNEDKEVHYPIICKDKLQFKNLEDLLYDKYPKYKETENEFYIDGNKIDKLKTLEENNIKNGQIIIMKMMS